MHPRRVLIVSLLALPVFAQSLQPGRNSIDLRGNTQDVYYYPAAGRPHRSVLFLPGDGGWRGFAIDIAYTLSKAGFDVYGWDVKRYLTGFTSGQATLSEKAIQNDTASLARLIGARPERPIVLVGWSQGAAMAVLAGAAVENQNLFTGVAALGLPEAAVLGWRVADNLTYVTKAEPNEPKFHTSPWLPKIAPLRFGMIHSTADEYVSLEAAKRLYSLAREPRRLAIVTAGNHKYDGNREMFFRTLKDQVAWAAATKQ